ncbi:MAG: S9 family peptidase [Bacteroidales bacterium]|nr:S9 family peptidase [Bacteroidales bacterium]
MKHKFKILFVLCMGLFAFSLSAQKPVTAFYYDFKDFDKPLILDSLNNQGKKFSPEDLFKAPTMSDYAEDYTITLAEDGIDTIDIHPCGASEYNVCMYVFNVNLQKKEKVKFEVFSNAKLKVSIDGKQVAEKTSEEDTRTDETKLSVEQELEPGNHVVGISMLCLFSKIAESQNTNYYTIKTLLYNDNINKTNGGTNSGLTLKTMLCGENPYSVSISSSGNMYLIKYYNTDEKGKSTYRVEVRRTSDDKIIFSDNKILSYQWLPEFDVLYYTEQSNIYALWPENGERKVLKKNLENEGNITFFGIGNELGYYEEHLEEIPFIVSKEMKKDNSSEDIHRMYLPDDRIPGWRDRTVLYMYGEYPIFHTYRSTNLNDIKDGRILFSMSKDDITKRPFSFNSIYEYNLEEAPLDTIIENDGFVVSAQYLKDGENIVILASNEAFNSIGSTLKKNQIPNAFNQSIYLMNLESKEIKPVGKFFNPSVTSVTVRKNNLYLTCQDKDSINVYRYDLKENTFSLLDLNVDVVHSFDISEDETQIVFYGENYNKPKRVFRAEFDTVSKTIKQVKEVFFPKSKEFSQLAIGNMEKWTFKKNNFNIDGRIYYPADFDSTKKYPMIVYYYGGCEPTDRSFEMRYSAWLYTQQGYVVYVINPSGTVGYGQEFAARHVNAWGDYTADEIITGVKTLCKEKKFIDEKHIGCMGASYGGFMTQYLQTKTDIFAAAVSHAGISNITSYWGEGYWGYSYSGAATSENYPWNNPKLYTEHSPLFNADKIKTPLLLLHGTSDTNVPIGESIQMYNALKILGKEVEFITIKGENHGIIDFNKRMKWNNSIYAWFSKWLKEDADWWNSLYPAEEY